MARGRKRENKLIAADLNMSATTKTTKWLYTGKQNRILQWAGRLAWLGHLLDVQKVAGPNPVRPTKNSSFVESALFTELRC
jgi:hypothetical protein